MFDYFDDKWSEHNHFRTGTDDEITNPAARFWSCSSNDEIISPKKYQDHSDSSSGSTHKHTPKTALEILHEPPAKFAQSTPWIEAHSDSDYLYSAPVFVLDSPRRQSRPSLISHDELSPGWKAPPPMAKRNNRERIRSSIPILPMPIVSEATRTTPLTDQTTTASRRSYHQNSGYGSKNPSHANYQHFSPVHTVSYPHYQMQYATQARAYTPPFKTTSGSYVPRMQTVPYYAHDGFRPMTGRNFYDHRDQRTMSTQRWSSQKYSHPSHRAAKSHKRRRKSKPAIIHPRSPTTVEEAQAQKFTPQDFEPVDENSIHAMAKNVQAIKIKIDERLITRHQALVTIYKKLEEDFQDILQDIHTLKQQDNFVFMLKVRSWEAIDKIQECMTDVKENANIQYLNITRYYKKGGDYKELFINLVVANESEISKLMKIYEKYSGHIKRYAVRRNAYGRSSIHIIG